MRKVNSLTLITDRSLVDQLAQGALLHMFSPVFVPCGFFLKSKYLSTELQENTRTLPCPRYVAHTALKVTIHSEI